MDEAETLEFTFSLTNLHFLSPMINFAALFSSRIMASLIVQVRGLIANDWCIIVGVV